MTKLPLTMLLGGSFAAACLLAPSGYCSSEELGAQPSPESSEDEAAAPKATLAGAAFVRSDRQANQHTSSTQNAANLVRLDNGETIVVWHSRRQQTIGTYGVYARRYDALGQPLGDEIQINANTRGSQTEPTVAQSDDGSIWFAWESYGHDGDAGSILARRFDAQLSKATAEFVVNAEGSGHQMQPALLGAVDGGAWIAWVSQEGAGDQQLFLQALSADGTVAGDCLLVDDVGDVRERHPRLASDGQGGLLCVWARTDAHGVPTGIHARKLNQAGEWVAKSFEIDRAEDERQPLEPAVSSNGEQFALGWLRSTEGKDAADSGDYEARYARLRFVDGKPVMGSVHELETGDEGYISGFELGLDSKGHVLAAWSRYGSDGKAGLFAQLFDAQDKPIDASFRFSESSDEHQMLHVGAGGSRVRLEDDGSMFVAWSGYAGGNDKLGAALTQWTPAPVFAAKSFAAKMDSTEGLVASSSEGELDELFLDLDQGAAPHLPPIRTPRAPSNLAVGGVSIPTPSGGFDGFGATSLTPPDPEVAVGPDHVLAVVNDGIRFFTKAGGLTFNSTISLPGGFFGAAGAPGGLVFDPEALFDPHSERFMVMANQRGSNGRSYFLLAVSDDDNPNGSWNVYRFDVTADAGNDGSIDSPNFAVDSDFVYLTADFFGGGNKFLVFVVEKAPTLIGGAPATGSTLINGRQSFGVPITYDAAAPAQYLIESTENVNNNTVRFWAVTGGTTPATQVFTLAVPNYQFPESPPQMGTTTRPFLFEPRFWSCTYINGSLWATHHVDSNRVRQRWYEFDMRGWPASGNTPIIAQTGEVDPGGNIRTFFGSIAVDENDTVGMTVSRSSPNEFISMQYTSRLATDAAGFMEPLTLARASTAPDLSGRWGDYSGVKSDPDRSGGFWAHGEYTNGSWRTWLQPFNRETAPMAYCTPKLSSAFCVAVIGSSDLTSQPVSGANDYSITAIGVQGFKNGLLFAGTSGPAATPFSGGTLCVTPPLKRGPITNSLGSSPVSCDGSFTTLVNDGSVIPVGLDGGSGTSVWYQYWYRDPNNGAGNLGTALSNALEVTFQ